MERVHLRMMIIFILSSLLAACAHKVPPSPQLDVVIPDVRLKAQHIPEMLPTLEVTAKTLTMEQAQERLNTVIRALDLPVKDEMSALTLKESKTGGYRFHSGEHKFEVYPESGGIKYQSAALYRLGEKGESDTAPKEQVLIERAQQDLKRLAAANIIEMDQIDRGSVHISHQRSRSAERNERGIAMGKLSTLDSRIDYTRRIGDLRVAGNGVRLIYGNDQRMYGFEIVWRPVGVRAHREQIAVNREEAIVDFREGVEQYSRVNSKVEVLQAELVYMDPGPQVILDRLEPTYLFLYRVRTPIPEKEDEFIVGKKLFYSVPTLKSSRLEKK